MPDPFTFEAEPFEIEPEGSVGPEEFEAGEFEFDELESVTENVRYVDEEKRIIDLTAKADKRPRHGLRDPKKVWAVVLHQMACCFNVANPLQRMLNIVAHFAILPDGRILQLHPVLEMLWASHCISPGSVAVEFAGNFPDVNGRWWFDCRQDKSTGAYLDKWNERCCKHIRTHGNQSGCAYTGNMNQVTPAQIDAGRYLVRYLVRTMGIRMVLAHRQASDQRDNDPGPDIWCNVGQWAVDNLGLSDGGPGFQCDSGSPIPTAWRNWCKPKSGEIMNYELEDESVYTPELELESGSCPTCGRDAGMQELERWEGEVPATPTFVRDFSGPAGECTAVLAHAGKTRAQALAIINEQIAIAITMLRLAATRLKRGSRSAATRELFRKIFRVRPEFVPTWLKQTATIKDRGDVVAVRCSRVADLLASGRIRYFCRVTATNCPDCGNDNSPYACSSWGERPPPANNNVVCLGDKFWEDMRHNRISSILAALMHEPFHIYFGRYVTEHGQHPDGSSVGKFGGVYCILKFVFDINGQTPPPRVNNVCRDTVVRAETTDYEQDEAQFSWEGETGTAPPTYVRNFSGPAAECTAALTQAGKTRAQALAIINAEIHSAIRMLRVAATRLKRGNRSAQTRAIFKKIFRVPPSFVPTWLKQTNAIKDRGDVVAVRCRRVADLLASGTIRFFCRVTATNCPDCGNDNSPFACSSWGKHNVICLGSLTWNDMKNNNLPSIRSTVMHEPFHIYFGKYVTEHTTHPDGSSVGKFGGIDCIVRFVFEVNGQAPVQTDVDACDQNLVRAELAAY